MPDRKTQPPAQAAPVADDPIADAPVAEGEADAAPARRSGLIQSVSIAARILTLLANADGPLPLGELARRAQVGASSAHRYLRSLVEAGLAAQDPVSGRYDLGPAALSLGVAALKRIDPVELAARRMKDFAAQMAASGGVAIWTDRGPTLVRWYRSSQFSISSLGLGDVLPLDNTACGLVFQAWLPPGRVAAVRRLQPAHFRGARPSAKTLAAIREARGAGLEGHLLPGVAGQAAPIFDAQGEIACVMTTVADLGQVQGPQERAALFQAARDVARDAGTEPAED